MNALLVPDLLAMAVLLGVLALVRRRYPNHDIRLWVGGLLLILLECAARIGYSMLRLAPWHQLLHIVALDSFLLAGVLFLRSSQRTENLPPRAGWFKAINTAPALLLLSIYGADIRVRGAFIALAAAGTALAVASCVLLNRTWRHLLVLLLIWLPVLFACFVWRPRVVVYLTLALLYLVTAFSFKTSLPPGSSGKIAVVTGFVLWSACFATHPWIAMYRPQWATLASEIWNMQKFLITVGFLVALFEKEVTSNEWMALHDPLTGLANRRLFQDRISNAIARAERDRTALILFCLDLNHFKEVNDTLGHDAGDALLRSVADNLRLVVRRTDTLARMGGDEFTLLATDVKGARAPRKERRWRRTAQGAGAADRALQAEPSADALSTSEHPVLRQATRIEQDLRAVFERPIPVPSGAGEKAVTPSVSIGVAVYPTDSTEIAELVRIADQRMYQDKQRQRISRGGFDRMLSLLADA